MILTHLVMFGFWDGAGGAAVIAAEPASGGVWLKGLYPTSRQSTEELREERERLGILPKQQKALTKVAKRIAKRVEPLASPQEIEREVRWAEEFNLLIADLTARNRQVMDGWSLLIARAIEARIMAAIRAERERLLAEQRDEDDAIGLMLMEM